VKGSYLLVLALPHAVAGLQVGRLGRFDFAPGWYLYVGSAFGPGGLAARIAYHRRRDKARPHWHFDYLRPHGQLCEAWTVAGPERLECRWCRALAARPELSTPAPGFGARDTGCGTHLFYLPRRPRMAFLSAALLGEVVVRDPPELLVEIHCFDDEP
jgi:Uri superfamily endonuclease